MKNIIELKILDVLTISKGMNAMQIHKEIIKRDRKKIKLQLYNFNPFISYNTIRKYLKQLAERQEIETICFGARTYYRKDFHNLSVIRNSPLPKQVLKPYDKV